MIGFFFITITVHVCKEYLFLVLDESPTTCSVFLNESGLELFMNALQVVSHLDVESRTQVETKVLGLLVSA